MDTHTVPVYREGEISPYFTASHASVEGRAGSSDDLDKWIECQVAAYPEITT